MTTLAASFWSLLAPPPRQANPVDLPPPPPVDPGPVFIGDAALPCADRTLLLENWRRAERARDR